MFTLFGVLVRHPKGERRARPKGRGHVVVSMYGSPVFDEVRYELAPYIVEADASSFIYHWFCLTILT